LFVQKLISNLDEKIMSWTRLKNKQIKMHH